MKRAALIVLLISTISMVGVCLAGSNDMDAAKEAPPAADIVDTAVAAGNFQTLVSAVEAAGLVDTLKGEGPFTVFAPTDEAFAKIPEDQLAVLLANKTQLAAVLTYHVAAGKVMSTDLTDDMSVATIQGENVTINLEDGNVMVNDAKVVQADIDCSNGVIHAIDTVLMP
ncbi:MAG TPA: fasciclin domain-containing protein [Methanothrix sp.]|nr:fasciclin domain-containing protein [Methanothrix sp.]